MVTDTVPSALMTNFRERLEGDLTFIGKSRHLKQVLSAIPELTAEKKPITIVGPLGAGRATLAKAIHLGSSSWWRPFVETDLTGLEDEEALKNLVGYGEGHLFSSPEIKPGFFHRASNSTIILKNFDRYSKDIQNQICQVYLNKRYSPISTKEEVELDCRFVFTVGSSPEDLSRIGFLSDEVCSMVSQRTLSIPSLSKRKDDILPLAYKFIKECSLEFGLREKKLSKEAERWIKKAPLKDNANQLKRGVYFACLNTDDDTLYPEHFALAHDGNMDGYQDKQLDELSIQSIIELKLESFLGRLGKFEAKHLYEAIIDRVEEPLLRLVMKYAGGNQINASRILGINRNTLRTKLRKHNIKVSRNGGVK